MNRSKTLFVVTLVTATLYVGVYANDHTVPSRNGIGQVSLPSRQAASGRGVLVEDCVVGFAAEVNVPAVVSGRIIELNVKQNDLVVANQLLMRQDESQAILKRRAAMWQQAAAKEQSQDDVDLQYARALYAEAVAERDTDKSMYQKGGGTLQTLRESELGVERAKLEISRAEKAIRLAKIQLEIRGAELESIDDELDRRRIKSPSSGVVLKVERQEGEWVQEGDTVALIARMDHLRIDAFLTTDDVSPSRVRGCRVTAIWDDGQQRHTLEGMVESADPQLLTGGRFRLHATIINRREGDSWVLLPGTKVQMRVYPLEKVSKS